MSNEINTNFGVNVWWTCPADIQIDAAKAHETLAKHGFEPSHMPVPTERANLSRTAYSFQDRRHQANRRITEKASDDGKYVTYGLLERNQQSKSEVAYDQSTTIKYDKESNTVEATGPLAEDFRARLAANRGMLNDEDIRMFMRRTIGMCMGIAKRPSGGIYFIPAAYAGIIDSARSAIADLDIKAKMYVERVMDGVEERQNVWESVEDEIINKIEDTLNAVSRIEKRASALGDHADNLTSLNELMETYTNLLGAEATHEGLAEKLKVAANTVAEKMAAMAKPVIEKPKTLGMKEVAEIVLAQAKVPMSVEAIIKHAELAKIMPESKNPVQSMASVLSVACRMADAKIVRTNRGMYCAAA